MPFPETTSTVPRSEEDVCCAVCGRYYRTESLRDDELVCSQECADKWDVVEKRLNLVGATGVCELTAAFRGLDDQEADLLRHHLIEDCQEESDLALIELADLRRVVERHGRTVDSICKTLRAMGGGR